MMGAAEAHPEGLVEGQEWGTLGGTALKMNFPLEIACFGEF